MFCITNDILYAEEFKVFIQDTSVRIRYFLKGKIKTCASQFLSMFGICANHLEPFDMLLKGSLFRAPDNLVPDFQINSYFSFQQKSKSVFCL